MKHKKSLRLFLFLGVLSFVVGCALEEELSTEEEFDKFVEDTQRRKKREAEREKSKQYFDALDAYIELEEEGY